MCGDDTTVSDIIVSDGVRNLPDGLFMLASCQGQVAVDRVVSSETNTQRFLAMTYGTVISFFFFSSNK